MKSPVSNFIAYLFVAGLSLNVWAADNRVTSLVCEGNGYRAHLQHYTGLITGWHKLEFNKLEYFTEGRFRTVDTSKPSWVPGYSGTCAFAVEYDPAAKTLGFRCYRMVAKNPKKRGDQGLISIEGQLQVTMSANGHLVSLDGLSQPPTLQWRKSKYDTQTLSSAMSCHVAN